MVRTVRTRAGLCVPCPALARSGLPGLPGVGLAAVKGTAHRDHELPLNQ